MSGSEKPWSNNPNAPQIPHSLYIQEKGNFAGPLVGAVFYGIIIALFFQCMGALFNPFNRGLGKIKWPLVAHTVVMFSLCTIFTGVNLLAQSIGFVNNRQFPGNDLLPPGPVGYFFLLSTKPVGYVSAMFLFMNNWLADGLLLYRCYVIYTMNYWVVAFPCLMFLASVAMGVAFIYQLSRPDSITRNSLSVAHFGTPFISISLALNLILTLMIVIRLVWHNRNVRKALGTSSGIGGMCKAVATILIESYALYAINFILYIRPSGAVSVFQLLFWPILAETQVIAPFLITIRVANQRALTGEAIASGNPGSIQFRSRGELTDDSSTLPGEYTTSSVGTHGGFRGESTFGDETTVGDVPRP